MESSWVLSCHVRKMNSFPALPLQFRKQINENIKEPMDFANLARIGWQKEIGPIIGSCFSVSFCFSLCLTEYLIEECSGGTKTILKCLFLSEGTDRSTIK